MLGEKWATKRPEELSPTDFIALTADLFGEEIQPIRGASQQAAVASDADKSGASAAALTASGAEGGDRSAYVSRPVWRKALFGASGSPTFGTIPANTK